MRRSVVLLFSAVSAAVALQPAMAQKFVPKAIQFTGDPEYSSQELLQAAGLKSGEVLNYQSMNGVAQRLMSTGMFDAVTYNFDGETLVFNLTPAARLLPVRLNNLPFADGEDVNAKLHSLLPLYHGRVPPAGGMMNDVAKDLQAVLVAEGIHGEVQGIAGDASEGTTASTISYSILSRPVLIQVAHVYGVSATNESEVQAVLAEVTKNPFDASASAGDLQSAVRTFYEDHGYVAVQVQVARASSPEITAHSILVPFTVTVHEGRVYKLAGVRVPPGAPLQQSELDEALGRISDGAIQGVRLRTALDLISASYKSKGYLDCKISPRPQLNDASGTVTYVVNADPGPVYRLGFVQFDDMGEQMRSLVMRYWQIMPGDVFNQSYVDRFIPDAKSEDPALAYMLADAKATFVEKKDLQNHTVNLVVHLNRLPASTAE